MQHTSLNQHHSKAHIMKQIWQEIFKDKIEYVSLIFDKYYNERYFLTHEEDNNIVGILQAIPYSFRIIQEEIIDHKCGGNYSKILPKALYLCGLATLPEYRNKGIMQRLINRVISIAKEDNYDFVFLIPANENLVKYYSKLGFNRAFSYREIKIYDGKGKYVSNSLNTNCLSNDFVISGSMLDLNNLSSIVSHLYQFERLQSHSSIIHSEEDWYTVLQEIGISEDEEFFILKTFEEIQTIVFVNINKEEKKVQIKWVSNPKKESQVLEYIIKQYHDFTISKIKNCNSEEEGIQFKGMILNLTKNENGKNLSTIKKDLKNGNLSDFAYITDNQLITNFEQDQHKKLVFGSQKLIENSSIYLLLE
ncbi:MAG: GNAT family N-acetyltransferase [Muribaculum sp.]|nr:GNAT family N-acetyltransferase [Muribaculum sp.]